MEKCHECNRKFEFAEADLEPLTRIEVFLCLEKDLDFMNMGGLRCPFCGAKSLISVPSGMRPPGNEYIGHKTVTVNNKRYPILETAEELGRLLAHGQSGALIATWEGVQSELLACEKRIKEEGGFPTAPENIIVACTSCYASLPGDRLRYVFMVNDPHSLGVSGILEETRRWAERIKHGRCLKCDNSKCYFIVDPNGFNPVPQQPKERPETMQPSTQKRWHFWKK